MFLPQISHVMTTHLPHFIKMPLQYVPNSFKRFVFEKVANEILKEAIEDQSLDFLQGKTVAICVHDLNEMVLFTLKEQQIKIINPTAKTDVTLSLGFNEAILMMARSEDPDTLFFQRRLRIEGNTALGLEIKNWLDSLEFEVLPRWSQIILQHHAAWIQR